jgi:hypothetical protein
MGASRLVRAHVVEASRTRVAREQSACRGTRMLAANRWMDACAMERDGASTGRNDWRAS